MEEIREHEPLKRRRKRLQPWFVVWFVGMLLLLIGGNSLAGTAADGPVAGTIMAIALPVWALCVLPLGWLFARLEWYCPRCGATVADKGYVGRGGTRLLHCGACRVLWDTGVTLPPPDNS